jgi:hypothetical protein
VRLSAMMLNFAVVTADDGSVIRGMETCRHEKSSFPNKVKLTARTTIGQQVSRNVSVFGAAS